MHSRRKISVYGLAFLVLFSSLSFTLNVHLCMGQVEHMAFFKEAKTCPMTADNSTCEKEKEGHHPNPDTKKACCEDQSLMIEGQDELAKTSTLSIPDLQFVPFLYVFASFLISQPQVPLNFYQGYIPPLIGHDIPVLIQSFLL